MSLDDFTVNELCERSVRRLAASRGCTVARNGDSYQILQAPFVGMPLTDDEVWSVLSAQPRVRFGSLK